MPGFALGRCAIFNHFCPLFLAQKSPLAIILQAWCRLGGAMFFRGLRPSSIQWFLFWLLGLERVMNFEKFSFVISTYARFFKSGNRGILQ